MARSIVVGIDGSEMSQRALTWAAAVGRRVEAEIQPVMVWDYPAVAVLPFPAGLPVPPEDAMQADHEQAAAMVVEGARGLDGAVVLSPIVARGSSGRVLCDAAIGADLLVVGSRGLGSLKSIVMGSVSGYCVNHAPCPVAVIPTSWAPGDTDIPAEHVFVGVDGSDHAAAAVAFADAWAPEEATLVLAHSWDVPVTVDGAALMYQIDDLESAAQAVMEQARGLVSAERRDSGRLEARVVRGDARIMLEEAAAEADLVVIGSRSHSGFERLLLGSVAAHTMHHLRVPTIVVRYEKAD